MKLWKPILALAFGCMLPVAAHATAICPTTASTNTDCGYIITIGPGGVITGAAVSGANPYDGSDDVLVGVINNSGAVYNGSFTLTGSGNGGGLFDFDGDGICTYTFVTGDSSYCTTPQKNGSDPGDYQGPINTFSNIKTTSVFDDTGTVNFTGLANGASTFFSLESSPSSIGSITIGGSTPEPNSLVLLGTGALGLVGSFRRRFAK